MLFPQWISTTGCTYMEREANMNIFVSHIDKYNFIKSQNINILSFLQFGLSNKDSL